MTYSTSNQPFKIAQGVGAANAVWMYIDGDPIADIDATDYFTDASDLGMTTGDFILIVGNALSTIAQITVDADGNGTVTALTAVP